MRPTLWDSLRPAFSSRLPGGTAASRSRRARTPCRRRARRYGTPSTASAAPTAAGRLTRHSASSTIFLQLNPSKFPAHALLLPCSSCWFPVRSMAPCPHSHRAQCASDAEITSCCAACSVAQLATSQERAPQPADPPRVGGTLGATAANSQAASELRYRSAVQEVVLASGMGCGAALALQGGPSAPGGLWTTRHVCDIKR